MEYLTTGYQKKAGKGPSPHNQEQAKPTHQRKSSSRGACSSSISEKRSEKSRKQDEGMATPPEKLWRTEEICQFFALGQTRLFRLIHHYGLPVYKIGGRNRFDPREVWQWLQEWRKRQSL